MAVAVVGAAVALFVVLRDDDADVPSGTDTTSRNDIGSGDRGGPGVRPKRPVRATISVRGGKPVGGVRQLSYRSGEQIRFRVRSDAADEVHVHGYDLLKDVAAGGSVSFDFPARIEGSFEVELEVRGEQLAELRVLPR